MRKEKIMQVISTLIVLAIALFLYQGLKNDELYRNIKSCKSDYGQEYFVVSNPENESFRWCQSHSGEMKSLRR